jgi:hypothetical protein
LRDMIPAPQEQQMNQAGAFENCVNPVGNLALNGTGFVIQTSPSGKEID